MDEALTVQHAAALEFARRSLELLSIQSRDHRPDPLETLRVQFRGQDRSRS